MSHETLREPFNRGRERWGKCRGCDSTHGEQMQPC